MSTISQATVSARIPLSVRDIDFQRDHFHVHIVNVNYEGGMLGMTVGHAHLLDDIISLVRGLDIT